MMGDGFFQHAARCGVFVLFTAASASAQDMPKDAGAQFTDCADCPQMTVLPAGSFRMGNLEGPPSEEVRASRPPWMSVDDEFPIREVQIPRSFAVSTTPITVAQYQAFLEDSGYAPEPGCNRFDPATVQLIEDKEAGWAFPFFEQAADHPVTCVNGLDAATYATWLSGRTGEPYRLLTEAEHEYAMRGGTDTPYYTGVSISATDGNFAPPRGPAAADVETDAWAFTSPVGQFPPNPFGLLDMAGNVFEWLQDCRAFDYEGAPTDGSAWAPADDPDACDVGQLRGGSWQSGPFSLRSSNRDQNFRNVRMNQYGLRVARDLTD